MKEFQMKAIAEAIAGEAQEASQTESYIQKLRGKRLAKPVMKVFENESITPEAARLTIVVIYTGDVLIIIIFR